LGRRRGDGADWRRRRRKVAADWKTGEELGIGGGEEASDWGREDI
jgi:hypothetical protein